MALTSRGELKFQYALALAKREAHDTYGLAMLAVELAEELSDWHDWQIDQGHHSCAGIPGGCTVVRVLKKVNGET